MQKVIEGQLVNYEVLGTGKKNLIILHGWGGSLAEWLPVAKRLEIGYKVWLLDFPGFGGSPRSKADWDIYDYANNVREFIKEFKIKDPIIMGHSFGGRVAIILGSKIYGLASKLILMDATGLEFKSLKAKIFGWGADYLRWIPQEIKNIFGSPDYKSAGSMRKIFVKVVNQDLAKEMAEVKCPTLIIWGEKDLVLPIPQAKTIKNLIKGSVLRVVWNADHWPHLSKPNEFLEIINDYL